MTNSMLFEGPSLEEVLSEARLCFGPDVEIEAANRVRRGGMLGFFASEWYEVWARPSDAVAENPALALVEEDFGAEPDSFQEMVQNAMADRRLGGGGGTPVDNYESALDDFFGGGTAVDTAPAPQLVGAAAPVMATPPPVAGPAMTATIAAPTPAAPLPAVVPEHTPAAVALEDSPRGESVFTPVRAYRSDLLWAMLDRLDAIPKAPPLPTKSGLVVFVGDPATAYATAYRMGERTGLWSGDMAVLSRGRDVEDVPPWLLLDELGELANRVARWHQRGGVVPIVVDQGAEAVDRAWALEAITLMRPDQVRLVVEAWRLTEDVGRLAGKVGGVDAIELVSTADSVEPLAMLDLDIPISSIEGRPATSELLAGVWLENRRRG